MSRIYLLLYLSPYIWISRDFCPDDILIANDGNLLVTYHGVWHNDNRSRSLMDGYAAPGMDLCFLNT